MYSQGSLQVKEATRKARVRGDVTMEAEVGVLQVHEPRNAGNMNHYVVHLKLISI